MGWTWSGRLARNLSSLSFLARQDPWALDNCHKTTSTSFTPHYKANYKDSQQQSLRTTWCLSATWPIEGTPTWQIRGMFLLRSGLRFSFRALEVPEPNKNAIRLALLSSHIALSILPVTPLLFIGNSPFCSSKQALILGSDDYGTEDSSSTAPSPLKSKASLRMAPHCN